MDVENQVTMTAPLANIEALQENSGTGNINNEQMTYHHTTYHTPRTTYHVPHTYHARASH